MQRREDDFMLRAIIWFALLIAVLAGIGAAKADELPAGPIAQVRNVNQGHIYLTMEPCSAKTDVPISDPLYRAYAVDFEGTPNEQTVEACWVSPEIDWNAIPEAERPHIVRAITILAPEGHETYLWTDFEPVNTPAAMQGEF